MKITIAQQSFTHFMLIATFISSFILIYLPTFASSIDHGHVTNSNVCKVIYATSIKNAGALNIADGTSLSVKLADQLNLPGVSNVNILSYQFVSSSRNKRDKPEGNKCDRDTTEFKGDRFLVEVQVSGDDECETRHSKETFRERPKLSSQSYIPFNLLFKSINGASVSISMVLCKIGSCSSTSEKCSDSIQNLDETDIDCGGATCPRRCNVNQKCAVDSDCYDAECIAGICQAKSTKILAVCKRIQKAVSAASQVYYPSDKGYNETINHYATSSIIYSVCSVEPGTVADVSVIMTIIGKFHVPFGIKGGGHSVNPGFSGTTGILIVMSRFDKITYDSSSQTVDLGSGLIWDRVYQTLDPLNVTVLGGRVSGVGIAGLLLGGGYSWKSNQYGLSIDTMVEYELVAPCGSIVRVNSASYPDIFFGLKGGFNNFGIVTKFTMRAVPQTKVYGGLLYYSPLTASAVMQAVISFQMTNQDPKAQILVSFIIAPGYYVFVCFLFYDAPVAPAGIFDSFINIPSLGSLQTQSYFSFVQSAPVSITYNLRSRFSTISVTSLTPNLLAAINNQLLAANFTLGSRPGAYFGFTIQPFIAKYFDGSQGGAYPHTASSAPLLPVDIQFSWALPSDDNAFLDALKTATAAILQAALNDNQDIGGSKQIVYPNYALPDTPLEQMYGSNVAKLQQIRKEWDSKNIMYLTGGFKF